MKCKPIIVALAMCAMLLACDSKGPESLPPEALGVWKTSAPKYEGCYFEITKDKVLFANSDDYWEHISVSRILNIEIAPRVKQSLYTIYYRGEKGREYEFSFYYDPSDGGSIRLKNQTTIKWVKAGVQSIERLVLE
jgi:hypothetical protein